MSKTIRKAAPKAPKALDPTPTDRETTRERMAAQEEAHREVYSMADISTDPIGIESSDNVGENGKRTGIRADEATPGAENA